MVLSIKERMTSNGLIHFNSNKIFKKSVICFDGPDGSGKDTVIARLKDYFYNTNQISVQSPHIRDYEFDRGDVLSQDSHFDKHLTDFKNLFASVRRNICNEFLSEEIQQMERNQTEIKEMAAFHQQSYIMAAYNLFCNLSTSLSSYNPSDNCIYFLNRSLPSLYVYGVNNFEYLTNLENARILMFGTCMAIPQIDAFHIYLYADTNKLVERNKGKTTHEIDTNKTKIRDSMNYFEEYYNAFPNVYRKDDNFFTIDTTELSKDKVFKIVKNLIIERMMN